MQYERHCMQCECANEARLRHRSARPGRAKRLEAIASAQSFAVQQILEQAVALAFDISPGELRARGRGKARIAFARQVAMYMAHVAYGLSLTDVGSLFGRDRTTVAHACGIVEDRRDSPVFDRSMDRLEAALCKFAMASLMLGPAIILKAEDGPDAR